ncbi:MAG: glycyl-radical enzyme activating protein [Synergistaceae bacterium]|jgi:pyruvate formate lyase activating enzyme|nr:glycyl-radical enzyme activating protein [Synergistaceae bacterium]
MGESAIVFNVQRYSLHDGPGIRTVVFFKGCPLRCRWCCNPESQRPEREVSYLSEKCIGKKACGFCGDACRRGAIFFGGFRSPEDGKAIIDRALCDDCLSCAAVCPSKAIKVEGEAMTISEILDAVEKDGLFYDNGGGGLTVSGGEPLAQGSFLVDLLAAAKKMRINTAMETCGYGDYRTLCDAASYLDTIMFDIKSLNAERHVHYTGASNDLIVSNFESLCRDFPGLKKIVRTPFIPRFNDNVEEKRAISGFLAGRPNVKFEALAYHRFGEGKYRALGREYNMAEHEG